MLLHSKVVLCLGLVLLGAYVPARILASDSSPGAVTGWPLGQD